MDMRFDLLLYWWDRDSTADFAEVAKQISAILLAHGIRMRQDDGELLQINFSLPESSDGLVLGVRYRKRDGTFTEDHFLCSQRPQGISIQPRYLAKLEHALPEYRHTHKQQIDEPLAPSVVPSGGFPISVNTITVTKGFK